MHKYFYTPALIFMLFGCSGAKVQSAQVLSEKHVEVKPTTVTLEDFVIQKLKAKKLNTRAFLDQLKSILKDEKKPHERVLSLNILGFLGKADYSVHYSERAIRSCRKFLKENSRSLHFAEKKYGISKETIAALLWVETQHGNITGKVPLVQAFLSLAMADHPEMTTNLLKEAALRRQTEEQIRIRFPDTLAFEQKIVDRTKTKSEWALEQLIAVDHLRRNGYSKILHMTGSYAGAFGVPQFIPTTYRDYAISRDHSKKPNLFKMPDVVLSVANYLKAKGWDEKSVEAKSNALFEYNRIRDYGDIILKIANELKASELADKN